MKKTVGTAPSRSSLSRRLCRCIKQVRKALRKALRKTIRPRRSSTLKERERAAIGICVRSVLHTRGKTLKRFRCKPRPFLQTTVQQLSR